MPANVSAMSAALSYPEPAFDIPALVMPRVEAPAPTSDAQHPTADVLVAVAGRVRELTEVTMQAFRVTHASEMLAAAQLEAAGWYSDLAEPIARLDQRILADTKVLAGPRREAREIVKLFKRHGSPQLLRAQAALREIETVGDAWIEALKDAKRDLLQLSRRMRQNPRRGQRMEAALSLYRMLLRDAFSLEALPTLHIESVDAETVVGLEVSLSKECLADFDAVLDAEREVHRKVQEQFPEAVGEVAVSYETAG